MGRLHWLCLQSAEVTKYEERRGGRGYRALGVLRILSPSYSGPPHPLVFVVVVVVNMFGFIRS